MAFFGTIYGAYEIYFRTAYECLMPHQRLVPAAALRNVSPRHVVYCAVLGLIFLWTMERPGVDHHARRTHRRRLHLRPVVPGDALDRPPFLAPPAADAMAAVAAGGGIWRPSDAAGSQGHLGLCRRDLFLVHQRCIDSPAVPTPLLIGHRWKTASRQVQSRFTVGQPAMISAAAGFCFGRHH